ncbi:site-specific integrase [Elizabethkingia sp. M8]|uniref:tyrosine-type recombinase/integrase n=1 Tax=Elizabethkingia sp. M8 TaxID=2796140 RepID=UPI0019051CB2|nr:site-specific integrase [Elizabethkingia sp. M8]QQM28088.1 site-specific integrase [Elizabethkingia sp. M8]
MKRDFVISVTLDKRRLKTDNTYPVRLRVFTPHDRKQKLYATAFSFTEKDFSSVWETTKPRSEYKEARLTLQAIESKANEIATSLIDFNFEDFERLMYNKTSREQNVNFYFNKFIEKHNQRNAIGTVSTYVSALRCLLRFHPTPNIEFKDISVSYLEEFQRYCIEKEGKSLTTIGIYLRNLRAVFNEAIEQKTITRDSYPFGKRKYQIQAPAKVKKALSGEQLKLLYEGVPENVDQEKAKAFWFFSYLCNGMNFHDILNLKCGDVDSEKITFIRTKTAKSTIAPKPIVVYITPYAKDVISKYGNLNQSPKDFIFPVFHHSQNAKEQYLKKQTFICFINKHFLKYAQSLGINEKISTYWARHSFTTTAIRKGASIEYVGEAIGHTDIKTTMNYFSGFEDQAKRDISHKLLDFN